MPLRQALRHLTTLCALFFTLGVLNSAAADEPPSAPQLQVETGMHTAWINQISTDAQGRWLATVSIDKTLRIWNVAEGKLVRTIRPPISVEREGTLDSVALSPDGAYVAAAGTTCFTWEKKACIYIFDRASGLMVHRIAGLTDSAVHMAWSPDGAILAAGLWGKSGIRMYETAKFTEIAKDEAYGEAVEDLHFSNDGRLLTASRDGFVRLYRVVGNNLNTLQKKSYAQGKQPLSAKFSPDGAAVAIAFTDSAAVVIASGQTLDSQSAPSLAGLVEGGKTRVAWSADGNTLYAAGQAFAANDGKKLRVMRAWSQRGLGTFTDTVVSQRRISDMVGMPTGGVAYASNGPSLGFVGTDGKRNNVHPSVTAQFWGNQENFRITPDGNKVRFGFEFTEGQARFNLPERRYEDARTVADLLAPITAAPGIVVQNWFDRPTPTINGTPIKLLSGEISAALAISPDKSAIVLGTSTRIRKFDSKGHELWVHRAHAGVDTVNISANSKLLVAASQDGTIRWHRLSDGAELLAFFPHADRKRWVLWTTSGYYDASPGGEDLMGWHLNRGKNTAADFFPASRFRNRFYRPDVVAKILETMDEPQAVRLADQDAGRTNTATTVNLQDVLPPVLQLIAPADRSAFATSTVTLKYSVRVAQDAPVTALRARVNGQMVTLPDTRNLAIKATGDVREVTIPIPQQDSEVQLFAENKNGVSVPATIKLSWSGKVATKASDNFEVKPKLYVLAVGVSDYDNPDYKLGLANKDARDFANALTAQKGRLYREVDVRLLTDKKATRDAVLEGLEWLQTQVTAKDVGMLFLAGHGFNDANGVYYFMPANANVDKLKSTGVVFTEIKNTLSNLAGKALFFVDTCHSGNVLGGRRGINNDTTAIINELASAENGVVVFSSSTGKQYSLEDPQWGNGAFTKALVEGFSGKADYNQNGRITHKMLDFYLSERVKELTHGKQTPVTQAPGGVPDFPIALSR